MTARAWLVMPLMLVTSGCFPSPTPPDAGTCDFAEAGACRAGLVCRFDGQCVPACRADERLSCVRSDGGPGQATCSPDTGWSACAEVPCTAPVPCRVGTGSGALYGEQSCLADGGLGACVESAACSNRRGVCVNAVRLFDDQTPGCGPTSFASVPGYRLSETCDDAGFDNLDNDCDGYVDELREDEGGIECAPGTCAGRAANGLLAVYRTCGTPTCPVPALIAAYSDAGYEPFDRCDGVDRNCDGDPERSPAVVLAEGATEVAAVGELDIFANEEGRYRLLLAVDGGLTFMRVGAGLQMVGNARTAATERIDGGRFAPRFGRGVISQMIASWIDDRGAVFADQTYNNLAPPLPWRFSTPGTPRFAQLAYVRGRPLVAIFYEAPDGGTSPHALISQSLDGGFGSVSCTAPNSVCLPEMYELLGWNGNLALLAAGGTIQFVSTDPADLGRQADGGPAVPQADGGFTDPFFFGPTDVALVRPVGNAVYLPPVVALAAAPPFFGSSFLTPGNNLPGTFTFGVSDSTAALGFSSTTDEVLFARVSSASAVARRIDGGSVLLSAFTFDGGVALTPRQSRPGVRNITADLTGPAVLAWSSLSPAHALLAMPVRSPDGGSRVVGELVCMPDTPP